MSNIKALIEEKIETLCEEEGFDSPEELGDSFIMDSIAPAICMNSGCNATYQYEPDCSKGWCDECETNSVQSIYVLMGWI